MKTLLNKAPTAARILLGLVFFVFGLNGFLQFMSMPEMSGPPAAFLGALGATGYMFPMIKSVEVAVGLALLSGRFVPLALTILAPVMINIAAFHVVLEQGGLAMTGVLLTLHLYLAWSYRTSFRALVDPNARPVTSGSEDQPSVVEQPNAA